MAGCKRSLEKIFDTGELAQLARAFPADGGCKRSLEKIFDTGELAQLARALAWHARGHRFEPGILHKLKSLIIEAFIIKCNRHVEFFLRSLKKKVMSWSLRPML